MGTRATAVINGEEDITEWDDEELTWGRRRDRNGRFTGVRPKVVPAECLREHTRRKLFETESVIRENVVHAANYLGDVVRGDEEPKAGRLRAAETLLDRFLGKPTERHQVQANVQVGEPVWLRILQSKVAAASEIAAAEQREAITAEDIIDAEVVEDRPTFNPPTPTGATTTVVADDDYVFENDDDEDEWE